MHFKVGAATDVGRKRAKNQDHFLAQPELGLFAVADGMGGHQGGEIASQKALEALRESIHQQLQLYPQTRPSELLYQALAFANRHVYEISQRDPQLQGMGTTLTCIFFTDHHVFIGQVGDSRCYLLKKNAIWQLTRDHSLVQEKVRAGLISRDQAKTDSMRNVITRSIGYEPQVEIDLFSLQTQADQAFLLCSDGLSGQVDDSTLLSIAQSPFFSQGDAKKAAQEYIDRANLHGGDDNITCIIVKKV